MQPCNQQPALLIKRRKHREYFVDGLLGIRTGRNYTNKYATFLFVPRDCLHTHCSLLPPSSLCYSNGTLIMLNALCCYFNLHYYKQEFSPTNAKKMRGILLKDSDCYHGTVINLSPNCLIPVECLKSLVFLLICVCVCE